MISGLHDPRWVNNILENYVRQNYRFKRLLIIENGNGIGTCEHLILPKNVYILRSEIGCSQYMNAGIEWLREYSWRDWWAKCDSDDYYGPNYLDQINEAAKTNADYAGRNSIYVRTTDNHLWYLSGNSTHIFHGPTLAAKVATTHLFPLVKTWGEDLLLCKNMKSMAKRPYIMEPKGFCYQRFSYYDHTWPCTDVEMRTIWQSDIIDLGEFDLNKVESGSKSGELLPKIELNHDNFMPFRLIKDKNDRIRSSN
jgi:hypothetical protein